MPDSVDVRVLARRDSSDLWLFVRVPLSVIRDVQFATKDDSGHLDLVKAQTILYGIARYSIQGAFEVYEDSVPAATPDIVGARVSLFSDDSLRSYETAAAHFLDPLLNNTVDVFLNQVWLDVQFDFPLKSGNQRVAIEPKFAHLGAGVTTSFQCIEPGQSPRTLVFDGNPGLIYLDPRTLETARQFLQYGAYVTFGRPDLLLLSFCLGLPFTRWFEIRFVAPLFAAGVLTSVFFSTFGLPADRIWIRPLFETAAALLVLLTAVSNILGRGNPARRGMLGLASGFVFGIVGCFDLTGKLQFAALHTTIGSFAYYFGFLAAAEIVMLVVVVALGLLWTGKPRRLEIIVVSALAGDVALEWLEERWTQLRKIPWHMPAFDANFLAGLLQALAVAVIMGGLAWWLRGKTQLAGAAPQSNPSANPAAHGDDIA